MSALARKLFGISTEEATFAKRGFSAGNERARLHLESIGHTFLVGYHAQLRDPNPQSFATILDEVAPADRGFAIEGAAMAAALVDTIAPVGSGRLERLLQAFGDRHVYMIHVGAGWAWARLRLDVRKRLRASDPLLGWLSLDGYGFHEGYFHWTKYRDGRRPARLRNYELRAFDQGLGRSAWFVFGGQPRAIAAAFAALHASRHDDLWSGVGLAATYAGGVDDDVLQDLSAASARYAASLAQGCAFAAAARLRAHLSCEHVDRACRILARTSAAEAAAVTDAAVVGLGNDDALPAFERWRSRIRRHFGGGVDGPELSAATSA